MCIVLVLALVAVFVENHVYAEKYFLQVELPGETIEPESCVCVCRGPNTRVPQEVEPITIEH